MRDDSSQPRAPQSTVSSGDVAPGEVRIYTIVGDRSVERVQRRRILAACLGVSEAEIVIEHGPKGKPRLLNDPTLHFSVSHGTEISMLAVTRVAAIGVDVERVRAVPHAEAILRRFFTAEDAEAILSSDKRDMLFSYAWTRAEATVKVRGASVWEAATPDPSVTVRTIDAPDGYTASVAVAATEWYVTQRTS